MEKSVERTQRTFIRLLFGILLGFVLLIAAIWGGRDLYRRWQEKRLVTRAMSDIKQGDLRDASVAARAILEANPSSVSAARVMAELAEQVNEKAALEWRRKAVQVAPDSADDALALVRTAVKFGEPGVADQALRSVAENSRNTAPYHEAAALLAQARHEYDKAEVEWNEALRLKPGDPNFQLQLGIVQSRSSDAQKRATGEATLNALRSNESQRSGATRALINIAVARKEDPRKLVELTRELQTFPEATWNDRMAYLDLLHAVSDPQFTTYLTELEKKAAEKPSALAALLSWMGKNNLSLLAIEYAKTLPPEALRNWPVPLALADAHVRLREWQALEKETAQANWGRFDFLRHAYRARALREQSKTIDAEREWNATEKDATTSESLMLLIQAVSDWNWENELTDLLWSLSKHPEKQKEAFVALYQHYAKTADTQGLYRVLVRLAEMDSTNLNVRNNLAQVSLLLNANPDEARRAAAEVYHKVPNNPNYMTTYAYSLMSQGNAKEALRLMSSLNEQQLSDPNISTYYGIFLAANGDEKARPYLDFGKQANLLPEEKALVEKAYAGLNSRSRNR